MTSRSYFKKICKNLNSYQYTDEFKKGKNQIEKDLEILEILKKHIYFSSKSGCIRMKDIYKSINNFDYEELREYLENERTK